MQDKYLYFFTCTSKFFDACNADVKYKSSHKIILKVIKLKHDYMVSHKLTLGYDLKSP